MAPRTPRNKGQVAPVATPAYPPQDGSAFPSPPAPPDPRLENASDNDLTLSDLIPEPESHASDSDEIGPYEEKEVIDFILECRRESYDSRRHRMRQNQMNRDAYMGLQDWSHKQRGQSTEFLPKTATAAEQFTAFIKKSLIGFGDWFQVNLSDEVKPYLTDNQIADILKFFFSRIPEGGSKVTNIESLLSDGGKVGLLESLMVYKIHWREVQEREFYVEPGAQVFDMVSGEFLEKMDKLRSKKKMMGRLAIDLIRNEDYFPDPTSRNLYEIHEPERDLIDLIPLVEAGVYDASVYEKIKNEDMPKVEYEKRRPQQLGQDRSVPPAHRKRVLLTEFWGTLLGSDGRVIAENCVCTLANKKYLIRKPEPNPFWHGQSPIISHPLIRVPFSVIHKALYDNATNLNYALNEMFNLILDGGIADVWGTRQLRINQLDDPRQVEGGIPQGATLVVKDTLPVNAKVLEKVTEASIPQDAMAVFEMLSSEFNEAALTNEIKLGQMPSRPVKATAITTAEQNQSVTMSSLTMDMELKLMEPMLRIAWLTILQHMGDMDVDDMRKLVGDRATTMIMSLSDAKRFKMFAKAADFKVSGLTATLASAQDFQKLMAFLQAASQNPVLARAFLMRYSPDKILKVMMKLLNINPDQIANTPEEQAALPQILQQIALFAQMFGNGAGQAGQGNQNGQGGQGTMPAQPNMPGPPGTLAVPPGQSPQMAAAVNQQVQPMTGLKLS